MKRLGFPAVLTYLAFAILLNLTLAHLREMPPTIAGDIGHQVLVLLVKDPLSMNDVNSWVFFGIGFIFSLVAMSDGLLFTDPYFGYAAIERRCLDAQNHYTEVKADLIERLRDIRDLPSSRGRTGLLDSKSFLSVLSPTTRLRQSLRAISRIECEPIHTWPAFLFLISLFNLSSR